MPKVEKKKQLHRQTTLVEQFSKPPSRQIFEAFLSECKALIDDHKLPSPRCFISYAWETDQEKNKALQKRLRTLKSDLEHLGASVQLDIRNLETNLNNFMDEGIASSDYIFLIGTPRLKARLEESSPNNAKREFDAICQKWQINKRCLVPLLLEGGYSSSFPKEVMANLIRDCREVEDSPLSAQSLQNYFKSLSALVNPLGIIPLLYGLNSHQGALWRYDQARAHLEDRLLLFSLLPAADATVATGGASEHKSQAMGSPELLINAIKAHYQSEQFARLPRQTAGEGQYYTPLGQSFINLALVKSQEQQEKEQALKGQDKTLDRVSQLSSFEAILQPKEPIALTALLSADLSKASKPEARHLLIEGRAGIGKTTLSKYLAHQWALGAKGKLVDSGWQSFSVVILLPLRQLLSAPQQLSLAGFIQAHCLPAELVVKPEFSEQQIATHLATLEKEQKVLYLLDGYDEIASVVKERGHHARLLEDLWAKPFWILISRAHFASASVLPAHRRLDIDFLVSDIKGFVAQYFTDIHQPEGGDALLQTIESNPTLKLIASVPINCEWLCMMSSRQSLSASATLTSIYQAMMLFKVKQHAKRVNLQEETIGFRGFLNYYHPSLRLLDQMAWSLMQDKRLEVVPIEVLDETTDFKEARIALTGLGLLQPVSGQAQDGWIANKHYYFVHLTLQEYFAARHWVGLFQDSDTRPEALATLKAHCYDPRFEVMWRFAAGLLAASVRESQLQLQRFFDAFLAFPQERIGLSKQLFLIRCGGESYERLSASLQQQLIDELLEWIHSKRLEIGYDYFTQTLCQSPRLVAAIEPALVSLLSAEAIESKELACRLIHSLASSLDPSDALVEALLKALGDQDDEVIFSAAEALGGLSTQLSGDPLVWVVNGLLATLDGEYDWIKVNAAYVLGQLGAQLSGTLQDRVVDGLLKCLDDRISGSVRDSAVKALGGLSTQLSEALLARVVKSLLTALSDQDGGVRDSAVKALGGLSTQLSEALLARVVESLLITLSRQDGRFKDSVAYVLGPLGGQLSGALQVQVVDGLLDCLSDQDDTVRGQAALALGGLGAKLSRELQDRVVNGLLEYLGNCDSGIRTRAAYVLEQLGGQLSGALQVRVVNGLLKYLGNYDSGIKACAAEVLGKLSLSAVHQGRVVDGLLKCLSDLDGGVRRRAAEVLGKFSLSAVHQGRVVAGLIKYLDDQDDGVRRLAAYTLGQLSLSAAHQGRVVNGLLTALGDQDDEVIDSAVKALGQLGAQLSGAFQVRVVNGLLECLSDQDDEVIDSAALALGQLGAQLSGALQVRVVDVLLECLSDLDDTVRDRAAYALGELSLSAAHQGLVVDSLIKYLGDQDSSVRRCAAFVLRQLKWSDDHQGRLVDCLLTALGDQDDVVRSSAAKALFTLTRQSRLIDKDPLENSQKVSQEEITPPAVNPSNLLTSALTVEEFGEVVLDQLERALEARLTQEVWGSWQAANSELWQTHKSKLQATLNAHLSTYQDRLSSLISSDLEEQCAYYIVNRLMEANQRVDIPDKLSRFKLEKSKVRQGFNDFRQWQAALLSQQASGLATEVLTEQVACSARTDAANTETSKTRLDTQLATSDEECSVITTELIKASQDNSSDPGVAASMASVPMDRRETLSYSTLYRSSSIFYRPPILTPTDDEETQVLADEWDQNAEQEMQSEHEEEQEVLAASLRR